jgi:hypothetical protein
VRVFLNEDSFISSLKKVPGLVVAFVPCLRKNAV